MFTSEGIRTSKESVASGNRYSFGESGAGMRSDNERSRTVKHAGNQAADKFLTTPATTCADLRLTTAPLRSPYRRHEPG